MLVLILLFVLQISLVQIQAEVYGMNMEEDLAKKLQLKVLKML